MPTMSAGAMSGISRNHRRPVISQAIVMNTIAAAAGNGCDSAQKSIHSDVIHVRSPRHHEAIACNDSPTPSE